MVLLEISTILGTYLIKGQSFVSVEVSAFVKIEEKWYRAMIKLLHFKGNTPKLNKTELYAVTGVLLLYLSNAS